MVFAGDVLCHVLQELAIPGVFYDLFLRAGAECLFMSHVRLSVISCRI